MDLIDLARRLSAQNGINLNRSLQMLKGLDSQGLADVERTLEGVEIPEPVQGLGESETQPVIEIDETI